MILDIILKEKEREVTRCKRETPIEEVKAQMADAPKPLGFAAALECKSNGIPAVIAEVKKASPSKGVIREDFNPEAIAKAYESAGASAVSVLTDEKFFQGSLEYLKIVKATVSLPVIRKDFVIDEYQIFEARAAGADAILLIAAALDEDNIVRFLDCAHALGMDALVEVHNEEELEIALYTSASLLGINNRNLYTFKVTLDTTSELSAMIPANRKIVSESGIFTRSDMEMLGGMGIDAVLIGEALMREQDIEAKLRELIA